MSAIAYSCYVLYSSPIGWNWFVLAILTLVSGSATVKLPSVPATISISETFVFTSVLLFGPAAGTLTVALDALVISLWLARKGHPFYRLAFNICALPASLWVGAQIFFAVWGGQPLSNYSIDSAPVPIGTCVPSSPPGSLRRKINISMALLLLDPTREPSRSACRTHWYRRDGRDTRASGIYGLLSGSRRLQQ